MIVHYLECRNITCVTALVAHNVMCAGCSNGSVLVRVCKSHCPETPLAFHAIVRNSDCVQMYTIASMLDDAGAAHTSFGDKSAVTAFSAHKSAVASIASGRTRSSDASTLITAAKDHSVKLWQVAGSGDGVTVVMMRSFSGLAHETHIAMQLAVWADGVHIITSSALLMGTSTDMQCCLKVWNAETAAVTHTVKWPGPKQQATALAVSAITPHQTLMLAGFADGCIAVRARVLHGLPCVS